VPSFEALPLCHLPDVPLSLDATPCETFQGSSGPLRGVDLITRDGKLSPDWFTPGVKLPDFYGGEPVDSGTFTTGLKWTCILPAKTRSN
jgi:hypothetical protein